MFAIVMALLGLLLSAATTWADETVINSKHDLSAFGPGPVRAVEEDQVCIFCHVPHNAAPEAPLWNRYNPTTHYRIYESRTTDARIDQPGLASKMCLSCHDGSIALGLTLDRPITDPILMTHMYMPSGLSDLTNDLSDDHPIGLRYDRSLSNRDPEIRPPELVDHRVHLGARNELECVACHDPHNNELGNFLRITERTGALCITCHELAGWRSSAHAASPRSVPVTATLGEQLPYRSMADNACRACHLPHSAPRRENLLYERPSQLCINCHNGIGGRNVLPAAGEPYGHRINPFFEHTRSPETRLHIPRSVECVDCHNPHAVAINPLRGPRRPNQGPLVPPALREVPGVSLTGVPIEEAHFYYEVCFRCHSDLPVPINGRIVRQRDSAGNVRRQFLPTAASAHPVAFIGRRVGAVPSLLAPWTTRAQIGCQDCHNNPDAASEGGTLINGPHGSRYRYLLVGRYDTADFTTESAQTYDLCYRCHDRNSILADESFGFHRRHVVNARTPCSACHTAHGVNGDTTQHSHLINFDISIVGGQRLFVDRGRFTGSCTLICHGVNHTNFTY